MKSPKIISCCVKELETVKHIPFIEEFGQLCKRYGYPIDTLSILRQTGLAEYGEKEEQEQEQEEKQQQEKVPVVVVFPNIYNFYESEGFGLLSSSIRDDLDDLVNDYGERWVCEAMKVSVRRGKRNLSFVNGILKNWRSDGVDEPWTEKEKPSPKFSEEERLKMERERPNERPIINL
nr:DnaD domain protein [Cohnella zeiphila]